MSEEKEEIAEKEKGKNPKKGILSKKLSEEKAYAALPFISFLTLVAVVYIGNSYYVERTIREISKLQSSLHELRAEDIELKTEVNMKSRQSEIVSKAEVIGLKPLTDQPTGVLKLNKAKTEQ